MKTQRSEMEDGGEEGKKKGRGKGKGEAVRVSGRLGLGGFNERMGGQATASPVHQVLQGCSFFFFFPSLPTFRARLCQVPVQVPGAHRRPRAISGYYLSSTSFLPFADSLRWVP